MSKDLIRAIKVAVSSLDQNTIFESDFKEEKVEEACVAYLKFKGYRIGSPKKFSVIISDTKGLVTHFYNLLNSKHTEKHATSYDLHKDLSVAKRFVASRMEVTGAGKEYALNECGEIIRTIFEHEEDFNFKYNLDFGIFGQDKLKWVTDKALQIMNKKLVDRDKIKAKELRAKAREVDSESDMGFTDLDEILAKMEEEEDG